MHPTCIGHKYAISAQISPNLSRTVRSLVNKYDFFYTKTESLRHISIIPPFLSPILSSSYMTQQQGSLVSLLLREVLALGRSLATSLSLSLSPSRFLFVTTRLQGESPLVRALRSIPSPLTTTQRSWDGSFSSKVRTPIRGGASPQMEGLK